jgi:hypothetical protein
MDVALDDAGFPCANVSDHQDLEQVFLPHQRSPQSETHTQQNAQVGLVGGHRVARTHCRTLNSPEGAAAA